MYAFHIWNKTTNEQDIIFGYSWEDACRRCNLTDAENWTCLLSEYED